MGTKEKAGFVVAKWQIHGYVPMVTVWKWCCFCVCQFFSVPPRRSNMICDVYRTPFCLAHLVRTNGKMLDRRRRTEAVSLISFKYRNMFTTVLWKIFNISHITVSEVHKGVKWLDIFSYSKFAVRGGGGTRLDLKSVFLCMKSVDSGLGHLNVHHSAGNPRSFKITFQCRKFVKLSHD